MFHKTTTSERIKCLNACIEAGDRDAITMIKATRVAPCRSFLFAGGLDLGVDRIEGHRITRGRLP